jgi:regulatory protein
MPFARSPRRGSSSASARTRFEPNDGRGAVPASPEDAERAAQEERRAAERAALRILGGAAQSQSSLRRRLAHRGFSEQAAQSATDAAMQAGYVDDAALAASIVSRRRDGRGAARIVAELRVRGIEDGVARAAVGAIPVEEERESAVREARRRLRGDLPAEWAARRRELARIGGALNRLGFGGDAISCALAALSAELT